MAAAPRYRFAPSPTGFFHVGGARTALSGSVVASESPELAAILAVLQATDRRVRALLEDVNPAPSPNGEPLEDTVFGF